VINPSLTPFCTQLTGTIQEDVEGQPTLSDTLNAFHEWMGRERLFDQTFAFVTFGDWDLSQMLPRWIPGTGGELMLDS
jgi:ERI1 exoribonuclease 3